MPVSDPTPPYPQSALTAPPRSSLAAPTLPTSRVAPAAHAVRRPRRWLRWTAVVVVLIVGIPLLWYAACFLDVWRTARRDGARPADAIVVLGAAQFDGRPSRVLEARLEHTLDLFKQGIAPLVFTTGGKLPADRTYEATVSANWLIARGVPANAVLRETNGRSTYESLAEVAKELKRRGLRKVVLVSDPYHSLRITETSRELGLAAHASPTTTSPVRGAAELRKMAKEAFGVSIARLPGVGYRRLFRITG